MNKLLLILIALGKWQHIFNKKEKRRVGFRVTLSYDISSLLTESTKIIWKKSCPLNLSMLVLYNSEKPHYSMYLEAPLFNVFSASKKIPTLKKYSFTLEIVFAITTWILKKGLIILLNQCWFKHGSTSHIATITELLLELKETGRKWSKFP